MKKINLIGLLMLVATSLLFIQCTSDPIPGPPGADGADGSNGIDGVDGVDGTASCVACHSKSHRDPIDASFLESKHYNETIMFNGEKLSTYANRSSCSQCHNTEGYLDYINTGMVSEEPYADPTGISCTTCHDKHSTFDFENDGPDYALRTIDPVWLVLDTGYAIDFEGTSNNCATCHQPRNSYAVPGPTEDYTITSFRFGPHHGPQSTMLEGVLGANISGSEGYPGSGAGGDNTHRTGASCVSCHMGETTDGTTGLHSWVKNDKACTACHDNVPTEVEGFATNMQTLHDLLFNNNYIDADGYVLGGDGVNRASSDNPLVASAKVAQAIWNYKTLEEDNSHGVHNPKYAKALLKNSIEALQD